MVNGAVGRSELREGEGMMLKAIGTLTALVVLLGGHAVAADELVSEATDFTEFEQQFCSASREGEHIFVVPAEIFAGQNALRCDEGESTLRMSEPADDPGHTLFNIDPPHGVETAFDCDGKADTGITMVALNCLPAAAEQADHDKT
jgi:hypothetical protein